jgi:hypothetical protein
VGKVVPHAHRARKLVRSNSGLRAAGRRQHSHAAGATPANDEGRGSSRSSRSQSRASHPARPPGTMVSGTCCRTGRPGRPWTAATRRPGRPWPPSTATPIWPPTCRTAPRARSWPARRPPALWKRAEFPALRQERAGARPTGVLAAGSSAGLLPKVVATRGCRPLGRLLAAGRPRIELHLWERRGGQHVCRRTALTAADFCGQGGGQ